MSHTPLERMLSPPHSQRNGFRYIVYACRLNYAWTYTCPLTLFTSNFLNVHSLIYSITVVWCLHVHELNRILDEVMVSKPEMYCSSNNHIRLYKGNLLLLSYKNFYSKGFQITNQILYICEFEDWYIIQTYI